jgi:phosphoesterase RecJ-like protein
MSKHLPDLQKFRDLVDGAQRILMITHVAPDGDAIGSLLGLGWLLWSQDKDLTLACEDPVPGVYASLPGADRVVHHAEGTYDLIISLDCSDQRRMGQVYDGSLAAVPLINIDHHVTNTLFGTLNWVDPTSVATAQIVLDMIDLFDWQMTPAVATCLLTGLVTDTRSFRTSNVDVAAVRAALRLMEAGASLSEIARQALEQRPLASVRLWGQAFASLQLEDGILWTEVTRAMRRESGLGENGAAGLANFLSGVREARVVVVFTERDGGTVDVGMRSMPGIDVAQAALRLGGGGHPQAAGCTFVGTLPQARKQVLAELRKTLAAQGMGDSE